MSSVPKRRLPLQACMLLSLATGCVFVEMMATVEDTDNIRFFMSGCICSVVIALCGIPNVLTDDTLFRPAFSGGTAFLTAIIGMIGMLMPFGVVLICDYVTIDMIRTYHLGAIGVVVPLLPYGYRLLLTSNTLSVKKEVPHVAT